MKTNFLRVILGVSVGLALAATVDARQLRTLDGGFVELRPAATLLDSGSGTLVGPAIARSDVAWSVRDASGVVSTGVLPGGGSIRDELPQLIQNPVQGDIHLLYSSSHEGSRDLFVRTWLGQSWSEPVLLAGSPEHDDVRPQVAFTPEGEFLMAWMQMRPEGEKVLFQYGELDRHGMRSLHAHLDIGSPSLYTLPVSGDVRLEAGAAELRTDDSGERALLFLADPDSEDVGLIRLDLRALQQIIGGGSFAPVPVNFLQMSMGQGTGGLAERLAEAGELLPTWRAQFRAGEGYYWFDDETVSGLGFRDGVVRGGLIVVDRPESDVAAHALMISELQALISRADSELSPLLARRGAAARRR